jgi:Ca2+-binding EF-hand superfamily protein
MKKFVIVGAAAVTLVATPVIAQIGRGPDGFTRAEVQTRVRDAFVRVDANRDGYVTQAEAQQARAAVRGERHEGRADRRAERFAALDANRDGVISRQEFFAPRDRAERRRERLDRREFRQERRQMRGMRFGGRVFQRMDENRDGRVSLAEATAQSLRRFDRVDGNRDGRITPEERRAVRSQRRDRRI